jgi:dTDP-4-dehydrorhamnose reductase
VREATDNHMIFRTAWMYGIRGQNFLKTMLRLALGDPKREIKVVSDQFGSPTWSYRLAQQIARLIESGGQGTYHATSEGYGTWYELATDFLYKMGEPHSFVPCTTKEYPTPAARPTNSILENRRLKEAGLNVMEDWQDDLAEFVLRFRGRLIKEASEGLT